MLRFLTAMLVAGLALTPVLSVLGPVVSPYQPPDHYGVDIGASGGSPVAAGWPGTVTFEGTVTDFEAVSVDIGGGVKATYSYLELAPLIARRVEAGTPVGRALDGPHGGYHFSVRIDGRYVDPERLLTLAPPVGALTLVSPPLGRSHNLS